VSEDDALALITHGLLVLDVVLHDTVMAWRVAEDHVLPGLLLRSLIVARGARARRGGGEERGTATAATAVLVHLAEASPPATGDELHAELVGQGLGLALVPEDAGPAIAGA